jgi:hypothetical protein
MSSMLWCTEWNRLVRGAVRPVLAEQRDEDRQRHGRPSGESADHVEVAQPEERDECHDDQGQQPDGDQQVVDEQMRQVGEEPAAEHLHRPQREELLQRHEDEEQHGDADHAGAPGHEGDDEGGDGDEPDRHAALGGPVGRPGPGAGARLGDGVGGDAHGSLLLEACL